MDTTLYNRQESAGIPEAQGLFRLLSTLFCMSPVFSCYKVLIKSIIEMNFVSTSINLGEHEHVLKVNPLKLRMGFLLPVGKKELCQY